MVDTIMHSQTPARNGARDGQGTRRPGLIYWMAWRTPWAFKSWLRVVPNRLKASLRLM
jgi:hypothetical protein